MRRTVRFRPKLRDTVKATMAHLAAFGDIPAELQASHDTLVAGLPKQRGPRAPSKPSGKPLERDVLRAILRALKNHPLVAMVQRRQSGVFREGDRFVRVGKRGEADVSGILKGGRSFAIEVKRPGGKPSELQTEFIRCVIAAGGVAGVATSVEEALAIIEPHAD